MARLAGDASSSREDTGSASASSPSSSKAFTSRFDVVEHDHHRNPAASSTRRPRVSGGGNTAQRSNDGRNDNAADDTRSRFVKNSAAIEARAKAEMRDTLVWVTRLSEGPADRRLFREAAQSMKQNAYRDVLTERHVNHLCAYPPCGNEPRRAYDADKPVYRINLKAKKVFDVGAASKYCSDECARRSAWYETVCLASNSLEQPAGPSRVQLLEDAESPVLSPSAPPISASDTTPAAAYPAPLSSLSSDALAVPIRVAQDEYSQLADNFLARLHIIERDATTPPVPPSFAMAHTNAEDSAPSLQPSRFDNSSSSILPFDMAPLQRELLATQSSVATGRAGRQVDDDDDFASNASTLRRVEVDVQPGYQEYMDQGWELYKQMQEAGEMGS